MKRRWWIAAAVGTMALSLTALKEAPGITILASETAKFQKGEKIPARIVIDTNLVDKGNVEEYLKKLSK